MTAPQQNEKIANGGFCQTPENANKTTTKKQKMHTTPNLPKETWNMLCANAFGARRRVTDVQSSLPM
jgi:hypothetical protein